VTRQFDRWIEHLARLKLPAAAMMSPGLDPSYVRTTIENLKLECPDELVELYSRSAGIDAPEDALLGHMWMYDSHFLLPFEEAVRIQQYFAGGPRWDSAWFPVFGNGGGDYYLVHCKADRDDWSQITYFMMGSGEEADLEFSSLEDMLIVISECFDKGICSVDERGGLDTDFERAYDIINTRIVTG
jgi:hypothetical protein